MAPGMLRELLQVQRLLWCKMNVWVVQKCVVDDNFAVHEAVGWLDGAVPSLFNRFSIIFTCTSQLHKCYTELICPTFAYARLLTCETFMNA